MSTTRKIMATTTAALTMASFGVGVASAAPAEEKAEQAAYSVGPGTKITLERADDWTWCTVAFIATTPSNQPVAVTAGHCAPSGTRAYIGGVLIGKTDKSSLEERDEWGPLEPDWAMITLNENAQAVAASDKVSPSSVGKARVGDRVCSDGVKTGWQCGRVTAVTGDMIWHNVHREPGDSGSPIIRTSDDAALGIYSGSATMLGVEYGTAYSLSAALEAAGDYQLATESGPAAPVDSSRFGS
ncbi:hypothetical protein BFN03_08295 [Rhodococcus sp. WMMA185]|uniref:S1 family peptidase n=1 Tax=Rhodococcus sp. WMMA185 TaxID=679318 RepID=UPI000878FA74|nr:S1 family peptidase [Rhodococcus sp. WMMA185]AOW92700.1 hypothetical protein BFN03_08295 [Rhodococcus sp. WMMA185]